MDDQLLLLHSKLLAQIVASEPISVKQILVLESAAMFGVLLRVVEVREVVVLHF